MCPTTEAPSSKALQSQRQDKRQHFPRARLDKHSLPSSLELGTVSTMCLLTHSRKWADFIFLLFNFNFNFLSSLTPEQPGLKVSNILTPRPPQRAGITGMSYRAYFLQNWGINPRVSHLLARCSVTGLLGMTSVEASCLSKPMV